MTYGTTGHRVSLEGVEVGQAYNIQMHDKSITFMD